jgi:hypothetical protein
MASCGKTSKSSDRFERPSQRNVPGSDTVLRYRRRAAPSAATGRWRHADGNGPSVGGTTNSAFVARSSRAGPMNTGGSTACSTDLSSLSETTGRGSRARGPIRSRCHRRRREASSAGAGSSRAPRRRPGSARGARPSLPGGARRTSTPVPGTRAAGRARGTRSRSAVAGIRPRRCCVPGTSTRIGSGVRRTPDSDPSSCSAAHRRSVPWSGATITTDPKLRKSGIYSSASVPIRNTVGVVILEPPRTCICPDGGRIFHAAAKLLEESSGPGRPTRRPGARPGR